VKKIDGAQQKSVFFYHFATQPFLIILTQLKEP